MLHALYFAPHVPSAASVSRSAATIPAGAVGHSPNAPRPAALRFQRQRPFPDTSVPTTHRIRRYIPTGPDSFRIRPLPPLQGDRTARRHRIGKHGNRPVAPPFRKLRHIFLRQEYMRMASLQGDRTARRHRTGKLGNRPVATPFRKLRHIFLRQEYKRTAPPQGDRTARRHRTGKLGNRPGILRPAAGLSKTAHRFAGVIRPQHPLYPLRVQAVRISPLPNTRHSRPCSERRYDSSRARFPSAPRQNPPTRYPETARTSGTQPTPAIPRSSRSPRNESNRRFPVVRCKHAPPPSPEPRSRQTSDVTRPKKNRAGFIRTGPMLLSCRTADIFRTIWRTKPPSDR